MPRRKPSCGQGSWGKAPSSPGTPGTDPWRDRGVAELFFVGFGQRDAFADVASHGLCLLHNSHRPMIFALNNDFVAALDPFQHRTNVANELGFGDA